MALESRRGRAVLFCLSIFLFFYSERFSARIIDFRDNTFYHVHHSPLWHFVVRHTSSINVPAAVSMRCHWLWLTHVFGTSARLVLPDYARSDLAKFNLTFSSGSNPCFLACLCTRSFSELCPRNANSLFELSDAIIFSAQLRTSFYSVSANRSVDRVDWNTEFWTLSFSCAGFPNH